MRSDGNHLHRRRCLVRNVLRDLGYSDAHVRFDWRLSDPKQLRRWAEDDDPKRLPDARPAPLDLIAFYDEAEHNWDTTAFVGDLDRLDLIENKQNGSARARELFELTSAPNVLIAGNGRADLWLKCWQEPELVGDIDFSEEPLRAKFRRYRRDLEREALARLRGGQRYLFDRVYHARREELVQYLHRGLSKATWLAPVLTKKHATKEDTEQYEQARKALSRVAIALMAARILEDKDFFGRAEQPTLDAREILGKGEAAANGFFQKVISEDLTRLDERLNEDLVDGMLRCLMAYLAGPASFEMVTPEAIGYLYETALTAERRRGKDLKLEGIHYTPRPVARHILERIPVEELPPSKRYVLDMACGSGSFLLSATERLREIFDAREADVDEPLAGYLKNHVIGNDTDTIAILVARLAYLLEHWIKTGQKTNVPEPSRWLQQDALALTRGEFSATPPSIIVGNPPFAAAERGEQLANRFLAKSLELLPPRGFLGMVMPGPFLKMRRAKSRQMRERLLRDCELLEVWEQPLQTVGLTARQETCVVLARKRAGSSICQNATLFKSTYSSGGPVIRALREDLRSTFTFAANGLPGQRNKGWLDDELHRVIASPIDGIWQKIDLTVRLDALCDTGLGIKALLGKARFSPRREHHRFRPYLRHQSSIRPYFLLKEDWQNAPESKYAYVDPDSAKWPKRALWALYEKPKIVLTNNTNRNSSCQLRAAFDQHGVFPDGDIACFALRDRRSVRVSWAADLLRAHGERSLLLWLAAILNSPIGNAWIATGAPPRAMPQEVRNSLPVPPALDTRIPELVESTLHASRSTQKDFELWHALGERSGTTRTETFQELVGQINALVLKSYGLTTKDGELLQTYLKGMTEPWVVAPEHAHSPIPATTYRRITGTVVSVDVKRQRVTLDMPRYSKKAGGPIKVPLPKHMPGWALREGAEFTCAAPAKARDPADLEDPWLLRDFRPLPYSYLETSEIERMAGFQTLETIT